MTESDSGTEWSFAVRVFLSIILVAWFALAYIAGTTGILTAAPDEPFRPVLLSAIIPVVIFVALYFSSGRFRTLVRTCDIEFLTMLQCWRVLGFTFLMLYAWSTLPSLFAWPAGLGDILVGFTAPFIVLAMRRDPTFAKGGRFIAWNMLGLLDFVVAAATAALSSGVIEGLTDGAVTSAPLEVWPLNLFPSFAVPIFVCMHLTVLIQVFRARVSGRDRSVR